MASTYGQVLAPVLPFMGKLPEAMEPGCRIRIKGTISRPNGDCRIQLQSNGSLEPLEDVALSLNFLPATRELIRNNYCSGRWDQEERAGSCPINFDEEFDVVIGADSGGFVIEIDGHHFSSFRHRCVLQTAKFIFITGGCTIRSVGYENWSVKHVKQISVVPSAPVISTVHQPTTTTTTTPPLGPTTIPFQFPAWPHSPHMSYFPLTNVSAHHQPLLHHPVATGGHHTGLNPAAMILQHPLLMNFSTEIAKNLPNEGTSTQYKLLVMVLWKIICILFKALKYVIVALIGCLGIYILSKRLRL
ncbi:uncharacterized protein LOC129747003 [Uranotaenia lowii]|uniref:uncharacterized protein LOC129747003 n=1 Tax=Uranotaenia lowii TaxID=190385 RepID=UPI0024794E43|nr:uncharacterized protein LOC129747003 [Uranotaenia lowii]